VRRGARRREHAEVHAADNVARAVRVHEVVGLAILSGEVSVGRVSWARQLAHLLRPLLVQHELRRLEERHLFK
jgi:hypothetical protein